MLDAQYYNLVNAISIREDLLDDTRMSGMLANLGILARNSGQTERS